MNFSVHASYRKWFIIGLCVQIITAWYSVGYHHPDEHFQILEFANYKMGHVPIADMPWEFSNQCRPALQPVIAFGLFKSLDTLGLFNPFVAAFLLRLLMGVLTWWVTCRLLLLLLPQFSTEKGRQIYVWCSFLLWFVPYLGVRFSAENMSGLFFFLALSVLLQIREYPFIKRIAGLAVVGLLLGFTVFLRLQMVFAFAGLGIWIFIQKWPWQDWIILIAFALIATGLSIVVDRWFYGVWVFTPYNYYYVNIIQHRAADFGVDPWWYYFWLFIQAAAPPVSIVLLLLFFAGIRKKPLHLFSLVSLSFLIAHFLIGHKEMRFLFPMTFAFIFLTCIGIDALIQQYPARPFYQWSFRVLVAINLLLLILKMLTPAQELVKYYAFIYDYVQKQNTPLISFDRSPYNADGVELNFYKPRNLNLQIIHPSGLANFLNATKQPVLFISNTLSLSPEFAGYKAEKIYCFFPDWLLRYNINNWEERSHIWAVYKVYPQ